MVKGPKDHHSISLDTSRFPGRWYKAPIQNRYEKSPGARKKCSRDFQIKKNQFLYFQMVNFSIKKTRGPPDVPSLRSIHLCVFFLLQIFDSITYKNSKVPVSILSIRCAISREIPLFQQIKIILFAQHRPESVMNGLTTFRI